MKGKLKIIFLSAKEPFSTASWSGIPFHMYNALSEHHEVDFVHLKQFIVLSWIGRFLSDISRLFFKRVYLFEYGLISSIGFGIIASAKLRRVTADVIFSPAGLMEIAFLRTRIPVVTCGDCSTLQMIGYYPRLERVLSISRWEVAVVERRALKSARESVFSSRWAADFTLNYFGKLAMVIPFGSNISGALLSEKSPPKRSKTRLVFIGADWNRKGGSVALSIHSKLLKEGINSHLTLVTEEKAVSEDIPSHVQFFRGITKDNPDGYQALVELLRCSHIMILPTRADCTPIVISEAFQFGIPVLVNDTGGVRDMVRDGVDGFLIKNNSVDDFVSKILALIEETDLYTRLSAACIRRQKGVFDWQIWAQRISRIMEDVS